MYLACTLYSGILLICWVLAVGFLTTINLYKLFLLVSFEKPKKRLSSRALCRVSMGDTKVEDEKFPVGMRVLVVDDDPTCLKLLETLLVKCQYKVTLCNRGKEALKMLKEDRNRFDIVICDRVMPHDDIGGLELLRIVGLEMDLPVLMLSAFSDTKHVMKGIQYGACDYLVKPVRIQELQNIWQHVVRKNKSIPVRPIVPPASDQGKRSFPPSSSTQEDGRQQETSNEENADDHPNDDSEEMEENGLEDEDRASQKKPRLFWSVELHQKFVDAVNQLGFDKAFPKKILDIMNVEGLTREKVASHLQKYRIYLKKIEAENEAANRIGGFLGAEDAHLASLGGGYGVFRPLAGSGNLLGGSSSMSHHQMGATLGRLNTASGLSTRGFPSSSMLQRSQHLSSGNSYFPTAPGKFESLNLTANQTASNLFQGFANMQQNKAPVHCLPTNGYPLQMQPNRAPVPCLPTNGNPLHMTGGFGNQSSLMAPPGSFQQNVNPLFPSNIPISTVTTNIQDDPLDIFCGFSSLEDTNGSNPQSQTGQNGGLNNGFNNVVQAQNWVDQRPDYILNSCNLSSAAATATPLVSAGVNPLEQMVGQSNNEIIISPQFNQPLDGAASSAGIQQNGVGNPNNGDVIVRFDENYMVEDSNKLAYGSTSQNSSEYLEDIVGRFLKQDDGETPAQQGEFTLDSFPEY